MSRQADDAAKREPAASTGIELEDLASLIGDGENIDWARQRQDTDRSQHSIVGQLEVLSQIARFHRDLDADAEATFAEPDPTILADGSTWGELQVIREIGSGSFGRVYRAWDPTLEREVALKIIALRLANQEGFTEVVREGRLMAKVRHPNVVTVYGARQIGKVAGIWMELVDGHSLAELVETNGPLPLANAAEIVRNLCAGLAAVHAAGLVHRDVKARNVVIDAAGRVVLMDFGAGQDVREMSETQLAGTPLYMAPELFDGVPASPQSDVYSTGVLLFFLLTGAHPVRGRTLATIVMEHQRAARGEDVIDLSPLPAAVQPVLAASFERDPARRLASADAFASALGPITGPLPMVQPAPRRTAWTAGVAIAVAAAAIAVWILSMSRPGNGTPVSEIAHHRSLTTSSDIDEYPVFSPDGSMVAFSAAKDGGPLAGNWDLWVIPASGGDAENVTEGHAGADRFPVWSPNGRQLAFWSERDNGGCFTLDVASGAVSRVSTAHLLHGTRPAWSPDGGRVACATNHSVNPLITITDVRSGVSEQLGVPGTQGRAYDLAWSPDGRSLAYVDAPALSADRSQLRVLDLGSGQTRALTDGTSNVWAPYWSPDGAALFFSANLGGAMDLWKLRIANSGEVSVPLPVTTGVGLRSFALSRDGTRLVFSKGQRAANAWKVPIDRDPARWDDADEVTSETALVETLDVDRRTGDVLIGSDRGGAPQVWTVSPADARRSWRRVSGGPQTQWGARISVKGDVAFYGLAGQSRKLWLLPSGGQARQITDGAADDVFPTWSPDGSSLAYYSNRTGHWDVWTRQLADGVERRMTTDVTDDSFPDWSPDGQHLVYTKVSSGNPRLWIATVRNAANEPLTTGPGWLGRWTVGGDDVIFVGHGERANTIWKVNVKTRRESMVADLRNRRGSLGRFALAIGERDAYFAWETTGGDLWIADVVNAQ